MRSPPRTQSVVGRSGEFILFQFYSSSLYSQLKEYLNHSIPMCQELNINTAEKILLQWLSDLMLWTDKLGGKFHHATSYRLTIGYDDCKDAIAVAAKLLLSMPIDIVATLASYKITIVMKQPSGKMSFNVSNTVVSCSVGSYALRWFIFFYNALANDLSVTDGWNSSIDKFSALLPGSSAPQKRKEYLKKISDLLDDVNEKLVVLPPEAKLNIAITICKSEELALSDDTSQGDDAFQTSNRFEDNEKIVSDRFDILDCLLSRKAHSTAVQIFEMARDHIYESSIIYESSQGIANELIRLKTRSLLESSFIKAIENIGIQKSTDSWYDANSLCSLLGWELEIILYDKFVGESNDESDGHVTEDYKAKVRTLRFNLEDKKNPLLCLRVLLGILSLSSLVEMSPEQLASKDMQEARAKVEEESKKNQTILPATTTIGSLLQFKDNDINQWSPADIVSVNENKPYSSSLASDPYSESILKMQESVQARNITPRTTLAGSESVKLCETNSLSPSLSSGIPGAEIVQDLVYPSKQHHAESNLIIIDSSSSDDYGQSLLVDDEEEEEEQEEKEADMKLPSTGRSGYLVMSASGMNEFLFTIKAMKISFSAGLLWDKNLSVPFNNVTNVLPDSFVDKGRVAIDEFNNFVSGKIKSNRWEMVPLKVVNIHDEDVANFKAFYKEYESIRRIAMFRVSDDIHLFLVTPKFIDIAQCLKDIGVNKKTNTYAVLLKRSA